MLSLVLNNRLRAVAQLLLVSLLAFTSHNTLAQTFSGTYDIVEVSDGSACGFGTNTYQYPLDIRHHGDLLSIHQPGSGNAAISGLFGGGRLRTTGAFDAADGWRVNTLLDFQFTGSRFSGSYVWTYNKAGQSCVDKSTYTGTRRTTSTPATLSSPALSFQQSGNRVTAQWSSVSSATSYTLYYAPYPGGDPITAIDLGNTRSITETLPTGTRFYVAVGANGNNASSSLSNVEVLTVGAETPAPTPTPTPTPVSSVTLSPASAISLTVNESRELSVSLRDSQGNTLSNRSVQWSSSNNNVVSATNTSTGVRLTARAAGTSTITATSEGRSASVVVTVTASGSPGAGSYPNLQSVRIVSHTEYQSVLNWTRNQTLFLRGEAIMTTGGSAPTSFTEGMRWTSSNPAVAQIVGDGAGSSVSVLYLSKGTTTITFSLGNQSARVVLGLGENVQPVQSVSFTPPFALRVGECTELTGSVDDGGGLSSSGRTYTWTSANSSVLSTNGSTTNIVRVCGVSAGTSTLTFSTGGRSVSHSVTVGGAGTFNGVMALPDIIDVVVGTTVPVRLIVESFDASWYARSNLQWSVSNTGVLNAVGAPVVQQGGNYQVQLTGRTLGTSTVTVRADTQTESAQVNVVTQLPARRVQLDGGSNLYVGETHSTTLRLYDWNSQLLSASGKTVIYSSSNPAVATVSSTGLVTARAAGETMVTATVDGITSHPVRYEVLLTPARIELTPTSVTIPVGGSAQFTARLISTTGVEITGRTISWRSSNTTVGSVSSGFVRGLVNGTTTVTASFGSLSASAQVVVGSGSSGGGGGSGGGTGGGLQPIVTSCSIAVPVTALNRGEDSGWLSANFGGKLVDVRLTLGSMNGGSAQNPSYQYTLSIRNRGTAAITVGWSYSLSGAVPTGTSYSNTIQPGGTTGDFFFGPAGVNPVWILVRSGCQ